MLPNDRVAREIGLRSARYSSIANPSGAPPDGEIGAVRSETDAAVSTQKVDADGMAAS